MKVAFISAPSIAEHKRSPETGCERMALLLPSSLFLSDEKTNYEQLRRDGYLIFCYGHKPSLYTRRKLTPACLNDYVNSRDTFLHRVVGIKTQSGFSYLKRREFLYDCYFPTVTTFTRKSNPSFPCVGYYARSVRHDTDMAFIEFSEKIPEEIPIIIMGEKIPLKRKYIHTYDENYFFSLCTHYFYMRSLIQEDPWPHTLLQAMQVGCSLLMPKIERFWKDGIDDILSVCDISPIDTKTVSYPWELDRGCSFSPKGEDFVKLYDYILDNKMWLPKEMKFFSEVYNYALKL